MYNYFKTLITLILFFFISAMILKVISINHRYESQLLNQIEFEQY